MCEGLSHEADPQHAQTIFRDSGARDMKPLAVPIVKEQSETDGVKDEDIKSKSCRKIG